MRKLALDGRVAMEMEEARRATDRVMDRLMEDPEFRNFLKRKLKELGL